MEKNKVLLIEDHHKSTNILSVILEKQGMKIIDKVSADHGITHSLNNKSFDLIVVDTKSNLNRNWLQLVRELQTLERKPVFILSNYPEIMVDGKMLSNPTTKPRSLTDSSDEPVAIENRKSIETMAIHPSDQQKEDVLKIENGHYSFFKDVIFIKNDLIYQRIEISELDWVEAKRAYCEVVTTKRKFLLSINLNTFSKLVKYPSISRVHRSFLVNIDKIDGFENNCLYIRNQCIPIGSKYRDEFVKLFPFIDKSGIVVN